ncbi:MAG: chemoreceptor glutamine deamidase CheD [Candidatus Peribacteria bacterium]|nr:chemoreceptor glutamine deamidase CheD [Candidatus Peribacteria bacterium]
MGELKIASAPEVLETVGVGSCVVVIIYDPVTRTGGMVHAILPSKPATASDDGGFRYVDTSITALIHDLIGTGARRDRLVAKIAGGAHMFSLFGDAEHGIGAQNIAKARELLHEQGITLTAEETGGSVGRSVRFDLASGICSIETHM